MQFSRENIDLCRHQAKRKCVRQFVLQIAIYAERETVGAIRRQLAPSTFFEISVSHRDYTPRIPNAGV